jgi:5,10-methenyltetrahydrofolate synthetase
MANLAEPQKKALRAELLRRRNCLSPKDVAQRSKALCANVARLLEQLVAPQQRAGKTLALYWPIQNEPDVRRIAADWRSLGGTALLPCVEAPGKPLVFRAWDDAPLMQGPYGIPCPTPDAATVQPGIALIPLCGFNGQGFRLGYGGGFYDRTLSAMQPRPFAIGCAFALSYAEFAPETHDVPMDAIATEEGFWLAAGGKAIEGPPASPDI